MYKKIKLVLILVFSLFVISNLGSTKALAVTEKELGDSFTSEQTKTSLVVNYEDNSDEEEATTETNTISFESGTSAEEFTSNNNTIVSDVEFVNNIYPLDETSTGLKIGSGKHMGELNIVLKNGYSTSYLDFLLTPWKEFTKAEYSITVTYIDQTKTKKTFEAVSEDTYRLATETKEILSIKVSTTDNGKRGFLKKISFETGSKNSFKYLNTKLMFVGEVTLKDKDVDTSNYTFGVLYSNDELDLSSYTKDNILNITENSGVTSVEITPGKNDLNISLSHSIVVSDFTTVYYVSFYIFSNDSLYFMNSTSNGVSSITKIYIDGLESFDFNEAETKILNDINVVNSLENLKTGTITVEPEDPYDPDEPTVVDLSEFTESDLSGDMRQDIPFNANAIDSTDPARILVIPVSFGGLYHEEDDLDRINKAFNGTPEETGWNSVSSFYETSSYGKVNLTIDVLDDWVYLDNEIDYYENSYNSSYGGDNIVLKEVTEELDSEIDFNDYDSDNNGVVDSIWLIYDYGDVNDDDFYYEHGDLFWAYVTWNSISSIKHDDVSFDTYGWAGMHFMDSTEYNGNLKIDAHTYTHETGHMFGLDDYYDYYDYQRNDPQTYGTMYGADLMDYTIGDHNPYSKFLLGWIDPMVITKTTKVTIRNFEETGDALLISLNTPDSIYGDYFFIDLYTNTGLNEYDEPVNNTSSGLNYGIRVLHGHSEIGYNSADDGYESGFTHDNTGFDTPHQLDFLTSDGPHESSYYDTNLDTEDLFQMDSSLSFYEVYGSNTDNNQKMLNGTDLYFDIEIHSMDVNSATLTIKFI